MKHYLSLISLVASINIFGQNILLNDTIDCNVLEIYVSNHKTSLHDQFENWSLLKRKCPSGSKSVYSHGEKIICKLLEETTDSIQKNSLIDSLNLNYELWLQFFGDTALVNFKKAMSLCKYQTIKLDSTQFLMITELLKTSIELDSSLLDKKIKRIINEAYILKSKKLIDRTQCIQIYKLCKNLDM